MNKHALKSGIIYGIVGIIVTILLYVIDPTYLVAWWALVVFLILAIGFVSYFGIQYRNDNGGYMTFGKAWIYSIQVFILAGILGTLFQITLYQVIDPELPDILVEAQIENQRSMLSGFGMPEDQMEEAIEQAREGIEDGVTPAGMAKGFLFALIFYAIGSLITGAIIKKKEPELE